jgi:hypothetical protein
MKAMNNQDEEDNYNKELIVNASKTEAFSAVSQKVHLWWGEVSNSVSKVGDEFTIDFGDQNWSFRVTEFIPNSKITWECIGGNPEFNAEWIGDILYWNIEAIGDTTKISFLQVGLTPEMNCYEICNRGWDFFIESLKQYVETGTGNLNFVQPN